MSIVKDIKCEYPGCDIIFFGDGHRKYCDEHSKLKYRKKIEKASEDDANILIRHLSHELFTIGRACDCCGVDYKITLYPKQFIYPRYCELHRNKFKRRNYKGELHVGSI